MYSSGANKRFFDSFKNDVCRGKRPIVTSCPLPPCNAIHSGEENTAPVDEDEVDAPPGFAPSF